MFAVRARSKGLAENRGLRVLLHSERGLGERSNCFLRLLISLLLLRFLMSSVER